MSLAPGTRLGPYEILSRLGAGGMGEVYAAKDTRLGREVAIKILPPRTDTSPDQHRRFEIEARSASALNHPNIVTIHDVGTSDTASFIAMELVLGRTLRELLAEGPLPVRRLIAIASQISEGLACAHEAGVVHRDLKPENVMVAREGLVKILDFGLAKRSPVPTGEATSAETAAGDETLVQSTEPGTIMGTVGYMSPEQALGRVVDYRSDQFSLGAVLYEMASGRRAFLRASAPETLTAILREEPEPLAAAAPRTPAPLCWIIERCLAKDPEERYASSRDLARDLATVRDRFQESEAPARAAAPSSLPLQRTAFVGRERERAALRDLLLRPDAYLVTLTGAGGIGKTRLALEAARDAAAHFTGGVYYVPLTPLADPGLIPSTLCQALGIRDARGDSPLTLLRERLQGAAKTPLLLVLDGFEHLIAAASLVAEIVAASAGVKVLVTSRSPLHVYGEHEMPVPPLATPRPGEPASALAANDAGALFLERAVAVKPSFTATEESLAAIAEICARLDGLPLAIELAAARVKLLPPTAMRARLESRLSLLTGGARDLPLRHQTLRNTIDWSHGLMSPAEQRLLRRLAVFAGGCTLEATEAVCDARSDLGLDVLDGMSSIVDKSLAQQLEGGDGEPRFAMLETIREYALERLRESGDEAVARRAHAAYFMVLAEEEGGSAHDPRYDRFDLEHDNFRAALDWCAEGGEVEWGLRIGAALFGFWEARDHLREGRDRLTRLLKLDAPAVPPKVRARALFAAGVLAGAQGDDEAGRVFLTECVEIARGLDDLWGVAAGVNALAVHALERGEVLDAQALFEENVRVWKALGDRAAVARALSNLASVVKIGGDYDRAAALYEECLEVFRQIGDRASAAWTLDHLADVAKERGDAASARALYEKSLASFRELGDRWGAAGVLGDLGDLASRQGNDAEAQALYEKSLATFRELRHTRGIARLLECIAASVAPHDPERTLRLAGAAAALRQRVGARLSHTEKKKVDEVVEAARRLLPDDRGTAAWMEGWSLSPEELEVSIESGEASGVSRPSSGR